MKKTLAVINTVGGIIYLDLIAYAAFQLRRAFSKQKESAFILQAWPH